MSGICLWHDEDFEDDEEVIDPRLVDGFEDDPDNDADEDIIVCKECGAIVEDGFQCDICGLLVGV
jgi:rubrerythrin